jgi:hypothetical protein
MADRNGYIGRAPGDSSVVVARQTFSPTGIQTDFTFASGYVVGYLDLYLNGARLIEGQDFTATDGSVVGLTTYAQNGDVLELVAYKAFNATNVQSAGGDFSVGGNLTVVGYTTANTYYGDGSNLTGITAGYWEKTDAGINTTSSVGIGTTNPISELMVENATQSHITVKTSGSNMAKFGSKGNDVYVGGTAGAANIIFKRNIVSIDHPADSGTETVRITSSGDVGIGTTNPTSDGGKTLQIEANSTPTLKLDQNNQFQALLQLRGNDLEIRGSSGQMEFYTGNADGASSTEKLRISSSGNVGINTNNPTSSLHVDGDVLVTGVGTAIQWDATSDITLKENIEVINEPIVKLSQLKGVTFDWKFGGHSVGVIAQDVEKVLPTAVGGSKDQKTVNYNAIIGLLVESVKDQQKQIEELKSLLDK